MKYTVIVNVTFAPCAVYSIMDAEVSSGGEGSDMELTEFTEESESDPEGGVVLIPKKHGRHNEEVG